MSGKHYDYQEIASTLMLNIEFQLVLPEKPNNQLDFSKV